MENILKSSVIFLLLELLLIKASNATFKLKQNINNYGFTKNRIKEGNFTEYNLLRILDDNDPTPPGNNNVSFYRLSIYLDTNEFNHSFPDNLKIYQDNFNTAMKKAKSN